MVQRRGYSEWVKLIEEFEKSGSSLEDFAAKLGVKTSTLQFWFYKLRKQASRAPRFLPVDVVVGRAEGAAGGERNGGIGSRLRRVAALLGRHRRPLRRAGGFRPRLTLSVRLSQVGWHLFGRDAGRHAQLHRWPGGNCPQPVEGGRLLRPPVCLHQQEGRPAEDSRLGARRFRPLLQGFGARSLSSAHRHRRCARASARLRAAHHVAREHRLQPGPASSALGASGRKFGRRSTTDRKFDQTWTLAVLSEEHRCEWRQRAEAAENRLAAVEAQVEALTHRVFRKKSEKMSPVSAELNRGKPAEPGRDSAQAPRSSSEEGRAAERRSGPHRSGRAARLPQVRLIPIPIGSQNAADHDFAVRALQELNSTDAGSLSVRP